MANNEIRIGINVTGEDQAARDLKKVGDAAGSTGDAIQGMGEQATGAGKATEKASEKIRATADDMQYLSAHTEATTNRLRGLVEQLNKTGDRSLFKDISSEQRELSRLQRLAKFNTSDDEGSGLLNFGKNIVSSLQAAKGAAGPVIAGFALAAAPLIGASISAAVLGATGAGGIVGGIVLAKDDPRVQNAAEDLGKVLKNEFGSKGAAEPFVAPLLDSIEILRATSKDVAGDARAAFATIAPVLRPLTLSLGEAAERFLPGFTKGLEGAKPVLRAVADIVPKLAESAGDFVETISEGGDGAVLALGAIADTTDRALDGLANLIVGLSATYEWGVKAGASVTGALEDVWGWVPLIGNEIQGANDRFEDQLGLLNRAGDASGDYAGNLQAVGESAEEAAVKVKGLTDAINEQFDKTMGVDEATLSYKNGLVQLQKELTEGKRSLDDNTQAGRDNIAAVLDQITNIENLRDANIRNGMAVGTANRQYEGQVEALRKTLLNLGYNKAEVNALIERYKAIPKNVETTIGIILKTQGSESAWAALRKAERQSETRANSPLHAGGRASGGPVAAGKTYWVGEQGPELVTFGDDGYVHNAAASRSMVTGASGGSMGAWGGAVTQVVVSAKPGTDSELVRWLLPRMQIEIVAQGGDVNAVLGVPQR